jgi:hypothetical protein
MKDIKKTTMHCRRVDSEWHLRTSTKTKLLSSTIVRPRARPTIESRVEYFEQVVLPAILDDADHASAFAALSLRTRAGETLVLASDVRGYSFSGITIDWSGPYQRFEDLKQLLEREGWVTDLVTFGSFGQLRSLRSCADLVVAKRMPNRGCDVLACV